jgi:hypothetical protein
MLPLVDRRRLTRTLAIRLTLRYTQRSFTSHNRRPGTINMELQYLLAPFLPLVAAAVTALVVAGLVRRDYILIAAPASAGLAAICVVAIGLPLAELLYQPPPGAGGPWAGGGGNLPRLIIVLSAVYGAIGAFLGLLIAGVVFAARAWRS